LPQSYSLNYVPHHFLLSIARQDREIKEKKLTINFVFTVLALDVTPRTAYALRIFVDNSRKGSQVLTRLHMKQGISHLFLQLVSQDSAQELFKHTIILPCLGVSWIEFQFYRLRTRFVSQGVVYLHSVDFGGSWTVSVIFLNVSRGSTLFVSLYILFS
jgi:hypothetical protein